MEAIKYRVRKCLVTGLFLAAVLVLGSCVSIRHDIRIDAPPSALPTSASAYLSIEGRLVEPGDYARARPFSFTKSLSVPLTSTGEARLALGDELEKARRELGGDAIVKLRFRLVSVDTSAARWVAAERYLGATLLASALCVVVSFADQGVDGGYYDPYIGAETLAMGLVGGAGLVGSFVHEAVGSVTYTYAVDGEVVSLD